MTDTRTIVTNSDELVEQNHDVGLYEAASDEERLQRFQEANNITLDGEALDIFTEYSTFFAPRPQYSENTSEQAA